MAIVVVLGLSNVIGLLSEVVSTNTAELIDRDISLRLGHALSSDPGLATVDDAEVQTKVQKVRGRHWEIKVGSRQVQGPAIATVLSLSGGAVALGLDAQLVGTDRDGRLLGGRGRLRHPAHLQGDGPVVGPDRAAEARLVRLRAGHGQVREGDPHLRAGRVPPQAPLGQPDHRLPAVLAPAAAARTGRHRRARGPHGGHGRACSPTPAGSPTRAGSTLTALATSLPLILTIGSADSWMFGMLGRGSAVLGWLEDLAVVAPTAGVPGESTTRVDLRDDRARRDRATDREPTPPAIVFDEVSFTYPGSDHQILDGLSLELRSGSASALVGVNGAGKSTLVKLLAAGYLPTRGQILVDGVDLAGLDVDERRAWQRRVAPITQDFVRLPLPAGDNVELGTGFPWSGSIDLSDQPAQHLARLRGARRDRRTGGHRRPDRAAAERVGDPAGQDHPWGHRPLRR